jgi:hypothetical protein
MSSYLGIAPPTYFMLKHISYQVVEVRRTNEVFVVMLVASIMGILTVMIIAQYVDGDQNTASVTTSTSWDYPDNEYVGRGPDNVIYHPYVIDNYGLNITYSSDNGTTWQDEVVTNTTWEAYTFLEISGIVVSSNNTTVIYTYIKDADYVYNLYLWYRWNFTGPWNHILVDGQSSVAYSHAYCAINNSDDILCTFFYSNQIYTRVFELSNEAFDGIKSVWVTDSDASVHGVAANRSGDFYIGRNNWDGVKYQYVIQDYNKTKNPRYANMTAGALTPRWSGLICLENDRFVIACTFVSSLKGYVWYYYQESHWGLFSWRVEVQDTDTDLEPYLSISFDQNNRVYIVAVENENLGDGDVLQWDAQFNASEGTWASSERTIYSIPTYDDYVFGGTACTQLWPRLYNKGEWKYASVPDEGYAHAWIWRDEQGATDDYYYQFNWSATWDSFDWAAMEEDEPSPDMVTDGVRDWWLWWGDAACISTAMIVAVVLLFGIIVIQMTTRR